MATTAATPTASPTEVAASPELRGSNTLLLGMPGAGKTTALATALEAGLRLCVVITDPGGEESLLEAIDRRKLPINKFHWAYVAAAAPSWDSLKTMGKMINTMGYKDLAEIKTGIAKEGHHQFLDLLDTFADFKCARTGEALGSVDSWGPDTMLALDSLSGLNIMAMELMIGGKPAAHQGEWGVAMNAEEKLLMKLCADTKCFFTLTAHVEKEMDETIGKPMLMAAALGRKVAPKLTRYFSDSVLAYHEGANFFWSTTNSSIDLKTRSLPFSDKLVPSFVPIVEKWKERNKTSLS